jgi:Domain of unknown function (DUF6438)
MQPRFVISILLCVVIGSAAHAQGQPAINRTSPRPPSELEGLKIRLVRTACFGPCPVYSIEIRGNGTVTYNGRGFVKIKGQRHGYIPPATVQRLVAMFISADYSSLRHSYGEAGSDLPSTQTSIEWPGFQKTVINYGGFAGKIPAQLFELEDAIDAAVNSQQWVGSEKERVPGLR